MKKLWIALFLLTSFAAATVLAEREPKTLSLSYGGKEYFHRWSRNDQHEFTPAGQEDLSAWEDMLTINVHSMVWDQQELAALANRVLSNYAAAGKIIKTHSARRNWKRLAKRKPSEHLIVAVLGIPGIREAVFVRLKLVDDTGVAIVASHRTYGAKSVDTMRDWMAQNGTAWEKALMSWESIPSLASLGQPN